MLYIYLFVKHRNPYYNSCAAAYSSCLTHTPPLPPPSAFIPLLLNSVQPNRPPSYHDPITWWAARLYNANGLLQIINLRLTLTDYNLMKSKTSLVRTSHPKFYLLNRPHLLCHRAGSATTMSSSSEIQVFIHELHLSYSYTT